MEHRVAKLCKVLDVSKSGYYAWDNRPKSQREQENELLLIEIKALFNKSGQAYGSRKITEALQLKGKRVNHKRVARLMKEHGLRSRKA